MVSCTSGSIISDPYLTSQCCDLGAKSNTATADAQATRGTLCHSVCACARACVFVCVLCVCARVRFRVCVRVCEV